MNSLIGSSASGIVLSLERHCVKETMEGNIVFGGDVLGGDVLGGDVPLRNSVVRFRGGGITWTSTYQF